MSRSMATLVASLHPYIFNVLAAIAIPLSECVATHRLLCILAVVLDPVNAAQHVLHVLSEAEGCSLL
jgi:hypothetical protein